MNLGDDMISTRPLSAPVQDIDDMASMSFAQLSDELLSKKDRCQQVDRQMHMAVVEIDPRQGAILKHSRAVDQRCHFTQISGGFKDRHCRGARVSQVSAHGNRGASFTANAVDQHIRFKSRCSVMHDDGQAALSHRQSNLTADPPSCAGYDGDQPLG